MERDLRANTGSGGWTINAVVDGDTPCKFELHEAARNLTRAEAGLLRKLVGARREELDERRALPRLLGGFDAEREEDVARGCERRRSELEEVIRPRRERRRDLARDGE